VQTFPLVPEQKCAVMPKKKKTVRVPIPPIIAAVVRPVTTRLSRMEDLLIEMRYEQDVRLKKIDKLQQQVDELEATLRQRHIRR
jgi:hypothetical protein